MSTDYNYDEQGQFFPYFILTITGLITLPLTYSVLRTSKDLETTAPRIRSDYKPAEADLIDGQKRKQKRRERKLKRMLFSAGGWLLMGYMVYLMVVTARTVPTIWDPYDVLGVSRSASEKQIKTHYRRLSLTQHPDKVKIDPALNQTLETANQHWVEITKAFKALTDEEVRNNYLQYGHPDGKQSFSMGIALPTFLVADGYGKYTLIFYLGLLGIFLPYIAGRWWYGTQKVTKDGILVSSAGILVQGYKEEMTEGDIIASISGAEEFEETLTGDRTDAGLSKIETSILADPGLFHSTGGLSSTDKSKLLDMDEGVRRKVLGLLWAYLGRVDLGDEALNKEKFYVAPFAWQLNEAFTVITQAFSNLSPLASSFHTSQYLIQAIPPGGSPLLQLPYFTPKVVRAIEGGDTRNHMTVQEYMDIPIQRRKKLTTAPGLLTAQQYQAAMATAAQLPAFYVERAFFQVTGERFVTPNSLVQLVIKLRFIPPGSENVPEVDDRDLEDDEVEVEDDDERFTPLLANAPYFAQDHSPRWHVFLGDSKAGRIAVPPFTYSTFDKPLVNSDGEPTYNIQTIKMQFGAPSHPGNYTFTMHLINDSYIGFDSKIYVTMVVEDASRAEDMQEDGEISEPDEDSLTGQMRALRSGVAARDEDESDESDTDGDEADDTSETDTDTDSDGE